MCTGCTKGRIVPGCPVHDPQERIDASRRFAGEDLQTTREKGQS